MKPYFLAIITLLFMSCEKAALEQENVTLHNSNISLTLDEAGRLSQMAFQCIGQEYPNKLGQVLGDSSYLAPPSVLHPAFYGCFDWHSSVHGHWSLVRLLKQFPDLPQASAIRKKISRNITPAHIQQEVAYFQDAHNKNYERTYGWAWLLKLVEELDTWEDPEGQTWREALRPLEELIVQKYLDFLPRLTYPIRVGEHPNTAFGLSFAWDYAAQVGNDSLKALISARSRDYYFQDKHCPLSWEPGGFDFLSPCLEEADIMSRVLTEAEFARWFQEFLPDLSMLKPAVVSDRSDGKIVHLDGLNFSRAWVLYGLAASQPAQRATFLALADTHMQTSLPKMTSGDYAGEHWLASFALYALSSKEKLALP